MIPGESWLSAAQMKETLHADRAAVQLNQVLYDRQTQTQTQTQTSMATRRSVVSLTKPAGAWWWKGLIVAHFTIIYAP
jgi:pyruvate/2-oxoacid:ferredoxin oxidoreductase beta subunit